MNNLTKKQFENMSSTTLRRMEEEELNNDPYQLDLDNHIFDYGEEQNSSTDVSPQKPISKSRLLNNDKPVNFFSKKKSTYDRFKKNSRGELIKKINNKSDLKTIEKAYTKIQEDFEGDDIQYIICEEGGYTNDNKYLVLEKKYKKIIFNKYFDESFDEKNYLEKKSKIK